MNCAFDKEKLTAFYDGELDAAGKSEVERHISACSECLRDLGEIKSASLLVKELPRPRAPRSIAEGVSREIAATGRVHSFSKARSMVLWATAAAAGLFVVANVIFLSGGPSREAPVAARPARPEPMVGRIGAPEGEKEERARQDAREEEKLAGKKVEADRQTFGQEKAAAPRPEPAKDAEARKAADLEVAKAKAETADKSPEAPRPPAKPSAPPPAAVPPPETKQAPAERAPGVVTQQNREVPNQGPLVLNVTSSEMAKVRPQVEAIVRRYADRANADRGGRSLEQKPQAGNDLKKSLEEKSAVARREAAPLTLDLTVAEYEALKKEIEQATGAQLAFASNADGRLRGAAAAGPAAAKAGANEPESGARVGGGQSGGLAKAPTAPNADDARRKTTLDENLAKGNFAKKDQQQQGPAGQQAEANRDKNAKEDPRRLQAGETRITIVINFLEVPVAEKK